MNNTLKYGLMGVIAVGLIANAYLLTTGAYSGDKATPQPKSSVASKAISNDRADNNNDRLKASTTEKAAPAGPTTQISFDSPNHDFGNIKQDSENRHVFTFTNTGSEPLIIENAKGSCGCTVPQYPKEPIAPGETGDIEVVYKPGKQKNQQSKTVTITANTEPRTTTLSISANVAEV